jgi:hypothetical protein
MSSTGIIALDSVIRKEYSKQCEFFQIYDVPLYFFQESKEEPDGNAFFYPREKTMCLGLNLIINLYGKTQNFDLISAVLAHEFGHVIQNTYNWKGGGKFPELHADFLAGFYIGKKNLFKSETNLNSFVNEFYSRGDTDFFSEKHHGSSSERGCAFLEGYMYAQENNSNALDANQYGYDYIMLHNPCALRKYKVYQNDVKSGNLGGLKIYTTDQYEYVIYVKKTDGVRYRYKVSNQRELDEIFINDLSANFIYKISVMRNSLLTGEIPIFDMNVKADKGVMREVLIKNRKAYTSFYDIYSFKKSYNERLSYKWTVFTGLYASPFTYKFPLSFTIERKLPIWNLSTRANFQMSSRKEDKQTDLKNAYTYKVFGLDLIKYVNIPFVKGAFLGPTIHYKAIKLDETNNQISDFINKDMINYGLRVGGKRFLTQRFCFGWDSSFGGTRMISSKQNTLNFDLNFMIGIMF